MVLFRRKGSLKREYDQKLLQQMDQLKNKYELEKEIYNKSIGKNEDLKMKMQLAEKKYFYLFKEAKARNLRIGINKKRV